MPYSTLVRSNTRNGVNKKRQALNGGLAESVTFPGTPDMANFVADLLADEFGTLKNSGCSVSIPEYIERASQGKTIRIVRPRKSLGTRVIDVTVKHEFDDVQIATYRYQIDVADFMRERLSWWLFWLAVFILPIPFAFLYSIFGGNRLGDGEISATGRLVVGLIAGAMCVFIFGQVFLFLFFSIVVSVLRSFTSNDDDAFAALDKKLSRSIDNAVMQLGIPDSDRRVTH